ncbi:maleylacetoacetate isomerase [Achromobacter aloeverae]
MQLYSFFNSSTAYRVRIALALKGLEPTYLPVDIRKYEHRAADYLTRNPGGGVPTLVDGDMSLGQSLAIIDYLDSVHPEPRLIPLDAVPRARVLELSNVIACDMHPVNNLRVLRYLQKVLQVTPEQKDAWYKHWIAEGLTAVEHLLAQHGHGPYCFGDAPTLADCCLVPQVGNALRMDCDVSAYARTMAVYAHCAAQPAFQRARPSEQPDCVK